MIVREVRVELRVSLDYYRCSLLRFVQRLYMVVITMMYSRR